jgi:Heavy-metal resistance
MKRTVIVLVLGLVLGLCGYCAFYYAGTASHRALLKSPAPELAWLKQEFSLSDAEFDRVVQLHDAFKVQCAEFCRRIDAKNEELKELLAKTDKFTPEIEARLNEAAQLRVECQKNMLSHFLEVSRSMPSAEGRRYLAWVQERTFLPEHQMHGETMDSQPIHEHGDL